MLSIHTKFTMKDPSNYLKLRFLDQFMIGHSGYIAGGCFKNLFNGEKIKDLDIFFHDGADWEEAVAYFDSMTPGYAFEDKREELYTFCYENDNVKAYRHNETGIVIELICKVYGSPEEILRDFDFTIVQFAYCKMIVKESGEIIDNDRVNRITMTDQDHYEYKVICSNNFFEHMFLKRLVIETEDPEDIKYPMGTFNRMFKYAKYGYYPCKETKVKIAAAIKSLSDEEIDIDKNLYEGMD